MGQKYAAYDSAGAIVAFYDSVDSPAPQGVTAIQITDAQWQAAISSTSGAYTVVNGTLTPPPAKTAAQLLAVAQASQKAVIDAAYADAVTASVTFKTSAGVDGIFQADSDSQEILAKAVQGYQIAGSVPSGFFWKAADNALVTFTLADLENLYVTMLSQGWAAFQKRTTLKAEISAATTVAAVESVVWA